MSERLARIEDGDPFALFDRAERLLRERALFLCPERLALRSMARIAIASFSYEGFPGLDEWVGRCMLIAINDLRTEQETEEFQRVPISQSADADYYARFQAWTKIPLGSCRLACVLMNQVPREDRLAFFAVIVEGKSITTWAAEGHGTPAEVEEQLRRVGKRLLEILDTTGGPAGEENDE